MNLPSHCKACHNGVNKLNSGVIWKCDSCKDYYIEKVYKEFREELIFPTNRIVLTCIPQNKITLWWLNGKKKHIVEEVSRTTDYLTPEEVECWKQKANILSAKLDKLKLFL